MSSERSTERYGADLIDLRVRTVVIKLPLSDHNNGYFLIRKVLVPYNKTGMFSALHVTLSASLAIAHKYE